MADQIVELVPWQASDVFHGLEGERIVDGIGGGDEIDSGTIVHVCKDLFVRPPGIEILQRVRPSDSDLIGRCRSNRFTLFRMKRRSLVKMNARPSLFSRGGVGTFMQSDSNE
jgi:hypothetical protein